MARKKSSIPIEEKQVKKCSVQGCENGVWSQGLCNRHCCQMRSYGKILARTINDPNEFIFEDAVCKIQIYDQKNNPKCQVLIDIEDYEKVKNYKWFTHAKTGVITNNKAGCLSRLIMGITNPKIQVDHINHDRLDNRKSNLRMCTNAENRRNTRKPSNNTSGYKGVHWQKNVQKWAARIAVDGQRIKLGYYETKEQAARKYNRAAKQYFGEFACLNVVESSSTREP